MNTEIYVNTVVVKQTKRLPSSLEHTKKDNNKRTEMEEQNNDQIYEMIRRTKLKM